MFISLYTDYIDMHINNVVLCDKDNKCEAYVVVITLVPLQLQFD